MIEICGSKRPTLDATPDGSLVACHRWPELIDKPPIDKLPAIIPS
jgi:hypothetical protein